MVGSNLRRRIPSSRKRFFSRVAVFDLVWASTCPVLAFLIRDGRINTIYNVAIYCGIALIASLIVFQWFKVSSSIPMFFSAHDAFVLTQACVIIVSLTVVLLFAVARLNEAPRSVPFLHMFILASGLLGQRAMSRLFARQRAGIISTIPGKTFENILILRASRLAWFFSKMVEEFSFHESRIVAILDERPWLYNRSLNGYQIVGSPANLAKIVDEYAAHGVEIHKVVVASQKNSMTDEMWNGVRAVCTAKKINIEWLHEKLFYPAAANAGSQQAPTSQSDLVQGVADRPYWKFKRFLDYVISVFAIIAVAPLAILLVALILIDVGYPIVFWQQRIGYHGRPLHLYKFRTMRASFDRKGRLIDDSKRISSIGQLLRRTRLDEIPQLFNVLMGSMSLIGPRPLLPIDQPKTTSFRLQVRPGISGLAQVSGGKLLSAEEKNALDEWYIQKASVLLDVKILFLSALTLVRGDRRNEAFISMALAEK